MKYKIFCNVYRLIEEEASSLTMGFPSQSKKVKYTRCSKMFMWLKEIK